MPKLRIEQRQSMLMRPEMSQILRVEQAYLLEMPEGDFQRLIAEIERSPLFQRLYRAEELIHYKRSPRTAISPKFYQLKEEIIVDKGSLDLESLLLNKEHVIQQIQKVGLDRFKRYFLFPESEITTEEIAKECSIEVSEVKKINELIDKFSTMSEFYHPSTIISDGIHYSKVASIEKEGDNFVIDYFSVSLARGRYSINYQLFEELKTTDVFTEPDLKEARRLFKKLELINSRKDTLTLVLEGIIDKQVLYLESGDSKSLLPLSQKELAKRIGVVPSSISRIIRNKSIDAPWNEEVPISRFFPKPKRFRKEALKQLLEADPNLSSDEVIQNKLWEKFGVAISRRSVANLRKELGFPAAHGKKRFINSKGAR